MRKDLIISKLRKIAKQAYLNSRDEYFGISEVLIELGDDEPLFYEYKVDKLLKPSEVTSLARKAWKQRR